MEHAPIESYELTEVKAPMLDNPGTSDNFISNDVYDSNINCNKQEKNIVLSSPTKPEAFESKFTEPDDLKKDNEFVDNKQCSSHESDIDMESKEISSNDKDKEYESEPSANSKLENQKKMYNKGNPSKQGKTIYPRSRSNSKELRELSRKHAILEKNLKIEGLPDPPKIRKRRLSLSSNMGRPHDKDNAYKRKRLASVDLRPKKDHMPKWELMGGDAHDPLNLNGLAHSEEGRLLNLKTPESSPLPTPDFRKIVYVKVPPNIEDPLNLEGKHDQKVIDMLLSATIKKRHRSKKKKHDDAHPPSSSATNITDPENPEQASGAETTSTILQISPKLATTPLKEEPIAKKSKLEEFPTPTKSVTSSKERSRSRSLSMSPERKFKRQSSGGKGKGAANEPTKFPKKPMFTLGNYNRYYGYRNRDNEPDPRLQYFNPTWFKDKDVLDIGCNVGHITLAIAEHFHPHKILGMDIDGKLIQAARQNIRHMLSLRRKDSSKYPRVFEMTKGPLEAHPLMGSSDQFPNNVLFLQGNYVPGSEEILNLQTEEYDMILALSITKWIHLNNGDNGIKLFFQKIFKQLRPGGRLILEPQPWSTYRKRAKLTPEMFAKYQSIKLKPESFKHYLLSIGFVKCEVIGVPTTKSQGFRRPLILFTKPDNKQTPTVLSNQEIDYRDVCQECGSTNKSECYHIQFTGMRRGPYASNMYDHINYSTSDSPYFSLQRTSTSASFFSFNMDERTSTFPNSSIQSERNESVDNTQDFSYNNFDGDHWKGQGASDYSMNSASGCNSASHCNSRSASSYSSSSSSSSSGSSSCSTSSSSYSSPDLNGDIAGEVGHNGPNGDLGEESFDSSSPEYNGPNGDIAEVLHQQDATNDNANSYGPQLVPQVEVLLENLTDSNSGMAAEVDEPLVAADVPVESDAEGHSLSSLTEPSPTVHESNGDHSVVQHWDSDNQDANIDAPSSNDQGTG